MIVTHARRAAPLPPLLLFRAGSLPLAVPAPQVRLIYRDTPVIEVPRPCTGVVGVIEEPAELLPVLSVGGILGEGIDGGSYLIALEGAHRPFALVATEIEGVELLADDAIRLPRRGDGMAAGPLARAIATARGEDFAVLNLQRLAAHVWPEHHRTGAH